MTAHSEGIDRRESRHDFFDDCRQAGVVGVKIDFMDSECKDRIDFCEDDPARPIRHDYWGFLPTTYNGPECPIWWANPGWLKQDNTRFLNARLS